jgi:hypothetical protein
MISRWFIPSTSGDYRLKEFTIGGKPASVLTVENPTLLEVERLQVFLRAAQERGWVSGKTNVSLLGKSSVRLHVSVAEAGPLLVVATNAAGPGRLTAVRSSGGEITTTEKVEEAAALAAAPAAEEAVTVHRPTPCCPVPEVAAEVRASDVLRAFCTPVQWADWTAHGFLTCAGRYTGHRYRIAHRCSPLAAAQGRICADLDDCAVLHFHDSLLPPPEEVLAAKLVLEHREDWLRNHSTCLSPRFTQVFRNPLGPQRVDGVADAKLLQAIAGAAIGWRAASAAGWGPA